MSRPRNGWVLPVSLLLALLLGLVPLPELLQPLRPYWLALVLAYWVLEEPDKIGLGAAFLHLRAELNFGAMFAASVEGFTTEALAKRQAEAVRAVGLADALSEPR